MPRGEHRARALMASAHGAQLSRVWDRAASIRDTLSTPCPWVCSPCSHYFALKPQTMLWVQSWSPIGSSHPRQCFPGRCGVQG